MQQVLTAALLAVCCGVSNAIFEEEAGLFDWKLENYGAVKQLAHPLAKSGVQRSKAFVITDSSTLACLDLTSGAPTWRQTLPAGEQYDLMRLRGTNLLTISGGGKIARMWNTQDGTLQWDGRVCSCTSCPETPARFDAVIVNGDGDVALLCDNTVLLRAGADGEVAWEDTRETTRGTLTSLGLEKPADASRTLVTVAGYTESSFVTLGIDYRSGAVESEEQVQATGAKAPLAAAGQKIADGWYASLVDGSVLMVIDAHKNQVHSYEVSAFLKGQGDVALQVTLQDFHLMLSQAGSTAVLKVEVSDKKPIVSVVHTFANGAVSCANDGEVTRVSAVTVLDTHTEAVTLDISPAVDGVAALATHKFDMVTAKEFGAAKSTVSILTTKRDGTLAHRLMLTTADASIHMLETPTEGGEVARKWIREEGLAYIVGAFFADAAPIEGGALSANPLAGLFHQIQGFAAKTMSDGETLAIAPRETNYAKLAHFGLHKIGVLLSDVGKAYAVDVSNGGEIIWSQYLLPLLPDPSLLTDDVKLSLVMLKPTSGDDLARAAVIGEGKSSTFVFGFDVVTGTFDSKGPLVVRAPIAHIALGPVDATLADGTQLLYMVEEQGAGSGGGTGAVHFYPDTAEAKEIYTKVVQPASFFFVVSREFSSVSGYQVPAVGESGSEAMWTLQFAGEQMQTIATRDAREFVQSPVRPLVDRSVLYKYLNPALLLVATSSSKDDDGRGEDVVTIYHIDTVVGRVVSRTRHKNAQGPVSAVLCENWAVYHYWSLERAGRWELGVVELYEGSESILGVEKVVNVFRGSTEKEAFDSYSARQPQVARKTAVFPHAVNQDAMTVTQTRYGVTLRHVLMGLGSGELYSLDKRMIDPRAPVNQKPPLTQDEAEEGILPYSAVIPIPPMRLLTYNQTIPHMRLIETAPAKLESVCHVFAIGLDLFYTRTQPSQKFDILADDFDYLALLLAMFAMSSATFAGWWFSGNKDLQSAWR